MQGSPDANAQWDSFRDYWIVQWGWTRVQSEAATYTIATDAGSCAMQATSDDFFVTGPNHAVLDRVSAPFRKAWQITVSKLTDTQPLYVNLSEVEVTMDGPAQTQPDDCYEETHTVTLQHVGLKLTRLSCGGIKLSNPKGVNQLVAQQGLSDAHPTVMPYVVSADLTAAKPQEVILPLKPYQTVTGSLRFMSDSTHPILAWIVGVLGRHLHAPTERHMTAAKHAVRFLKGNPDAGTSFTHRGPLHIEGYSDSDYASDPDTRRSITGGLILASGQPVTWMSARQKTVTHSSTEAEYIAADTGTRTLVWLLKFADELDVPLVKRQRTLRISDKPATRYHDGEIIPDHRPEAQLKIDNTGAIAIAQASSPTRRTKHLDVRYHYIQEIVHKGIIKLAQVPTTEQLADAFTKPIGRVKFNEFLRSIHFS